MIDPPNQLMVWQQGQACSTCGRPAAVELHRFQGGNDEWSYVAPLYHDAERNLGFCSIDCCMENVRLTYRPKPT